MNIIQSFSALVGTCLLLGACSKGGGDAAAPAVIVPPPTPITIETTQLMGTDRYMNATAFAVPQTSRGSAIMRVRLAAAPLAPVIVTVQHQTGDPDQVIYNLSNNTTSSTRQLTFDSTTWNIWQSVYFVTVTDTNAQMAEATYGLSGTNLVSKSVTSLPAETADVTVTGTIIRQGFVARASFTDPVNDIAFTLSWKKVGTGTAAKYYGIYRDNDPLNQFTGGDAGGINGNDARAAFTYPAYGFWNGAELLFVVAKSVITPRTTTEANLVLLRAADETFASGTGLLTASGATSSTIGSYPITFTASVAATPGALSPFYPLAADSEYPLDTAMQTASYGGSGGLSPIGQWRLTLDPARRLYSGTVIDNSANPAGTVHGLVTGSATGLGVPNLLGVRINGSEVHVYGTPFYSLPGTAFPFGSLGGRYVDAATGVTDRIFIFVSFTSN